MSDINDMDGLDSLLADVEDQRQKSIQLLRQDDSTNVNVQVGYFHT
jgi:hypothetical protein